MFEDFGERLRKLRTAAGLTQAELGSKINRGVTSISKYESGAMQPTLEAAVELAFHLKVSIDELFGYENKSVISTFGLTDEEKEIVSRLILLFRTCGGKAPQRVTLSSEQYEVMGKILEIFYKKNNWGVDS